MSEERSDEPSFITELLKLPAFQDLEDDETTEEAKQEGLKILGEYLLQLPAFREVSEGEYDELNRIFFEAKEAFRMGEMSQAGIDELRDEVFDYYEANPDSVPASRKLGLF